MPVATNRTRTLAALGLGIGFLLISFLSRGVPTPYSKPVAEASEPDAHKWYKAGVDALAKGEYDLAVADLSEAIKSYNRLRSAAWRKFMTDVWRSIDGLQTSIPKEKWDSYIDERFRNEAKLAKALAKRGEAYSKKGQFPEAIAEYSKAVGLDKDTETLRLRAAAYRAIGETAKAEWDERQAEFLSRPKETEKPGLCYP
jgi:tetratricopeptide (TPR) repeat protein